MTRGCSGWMMNFLLNPLQRILRFTGTSSACRTWNIKTLAAAKTLRSKNMTAWTDIRHEVGNTMDCWWKTVILLKLIKFSSKKWRRLSIKGYYINAVMKGGVIMRCLSLKPDVNITGNVFASSDTVSKFPGTGLLLFFSFHFPTPFDI